MHSESLVKICLSFEISLSLYFQPGAKVRHPSDGYELESVSTCSICHLPYSEGSVPFRVTMLKCAVCR